MRVARVARVLSESSNRAGATRSLAQFVGLGVDFSQLLSIRQSNALSFEMPRIDRRYSDRVGQR